VDHIAVATFNKVIRCKVPKVVGLRLKKARARIVRAHCRVGKVTKRFSTRRKKGRVLSQKPKPGRLLAAGARVNLVVGKGPRR
jgi:beta-lactam-binding protein with PASTA domain